jgi:L-threonylcarbamoyladenylate synthase
VAHSILNIREIFRIMSGQSTDIAQLQSQFPATRVVKIDPHNIDDQLLRDSVIPLIVRGEPVAFPTETVYGIGANATDATAVSKIFKAKGRPSDNPLIVHISNLQQLSDLIDPSAFPQPGSIADKLCSLFWPGPLTILFPKSDKIPSIVTAGLNQVGIRMPSHPIARKLIEMSGIPLAAPSANRSGRPSPTCAAHVLLDLGRSQPLEETTSGDQVEFGKGLGVECIVDGGDCTLGVESTVVSLDTLQILRPGGITLEQLQAQVDPRFSLFPSLIHSKELTEADKEFINKPSTPGLKYTHYAPDAPVVLAEYNSDLAEFQRRIHTFLDEYIAANPGKSIGILRIHQDISYDKYDNLIFHSIGSSGQLAEVAKNLFSGFRIFETQDVSMILMEGVEEQHEGTAVMNRSRKAASKII